MEKLWREKTGSNKPFNCEEVQLTLEDLDELERDIHNMHLPETAGFFFGCDSYEEYEEWHKENDLQFIEDAREQIAKGNEVYYSSWW